jgi:hypothetical protein
MKPVALLTLATLVLGAALIFFVECVSFLAKRDYVAAFLIFFIGLTLTRAASDLARFSLAGSAPANRGRG